MKLKTKMTTRGDDVELALGGVLDETAELPELATPIKGRLRILLDDMEMINSLGCRKWVQWIRAIEAGAGIGLAKCSPPVVNQMNILAGFLPEAVRVESLFVPYHCEACDRERRVLFELKPDDVAGQIEAWPEHAACPVCGGETELDVIKARYFSFATRKTA